MLEIRFDINNVSSKTASSERVPNDTKKTGILTAINISTRSSSCIAETDSQGLVPGVTTGGQNRLPPAVFDLAVAGVVFSKEM